MTHDEAQKHLSELEQAWRSLAGQGHVVIGGAQVSEEVFRGWVNLRERTAVEAGTSETNKKMADMVRGFEQATRENNESSHQLLRTNEKLNDAIERLTTEKGALERKLADQASWFRREYELRDQKLEMKLRNEYEGRLRNAVASISREAQRLVPINQRAALNDHLAKKGIDVAALAVGKLLGIGGAGG